MCLPSKTQSLWLCIYAFTGASLPAVGGSVGTRAASTRVLAGSARGWWWPWSCSSSSKCRLQLVTVVRLCVRRPAPRSCGRCWLCGARAHPDDADPLRLRRVWPLPVRHHLCWPGHLVSGARGRGAHSCRARAAPMDSCKRHACDLRRWGAAALMFTIYGREVQDNYMSIPAVSAARSTDLDTHNHARSTAHICTPTLARHCRSPGLGSLAPTSAPTMRAPTCARGGGGGGARGAAGRNCSTHECAGTLRCSPGCPTYPPLCAVGALRHHGHQLVRHAFASACAVCALKLRTSPSHPAARLLLLFATLAQGPSHPLPHPVHLPTVRGDAVRRVPPPRKEG